MNLEMLKMQLKDKFLKLMNLVVGMLLLQMENQENLLQQEKLIREYFQLRQLTQYGILEEKYIKLGYQNNLLIEVVTICYSYQKLEHRQIEKKKRLMVLTINIQVNPDKFLKVLKDLMEFKKHLKHTQKNMVPKQLCHSRLDILEILMALKHSIRSK